MPQMGQNPGCFNRTWGCIEQVQMLSLDFMPSRLGQKEKARKPQPISPSTNARFIKTLFVTMGGLPE